VGGIGKAPEGFFVFLQARKSLRILGPFFLDHLL
jgi:hypothetical protein